MAIGPAGELIRLAGDEAEKVRPKLEAELREAYAQYVTDDGVRAPASVWIVTAALARLGRRDQPPRLALEAGLDHRRLELVADDRLAVDPLEAEAGQAALPGPPRRSRAERRRELVALEAGEEQQALAAALDVEHRLAVAEQDERAGDPARPAAAAAVVVGIAVAGRAGAATSGSRRRAAPDR